MSELCHLDLILYYTTKDEVNNAVILFLLFSGTNGTLKTIPS